jgi:hypothetical protein
MQQFLQFIIHTFIYSSTCFGRPQAHHQELNNCSGSLWFLLSERGDSSAFGNLFGLYDDANFKVREISKNICFKEQYRIFR